MSLESSPYYDEITGTPNSQVSLICQTNSLNSISVLLMAINGSFQNQTYTIEVSNDKAKWYKVREIDCGIGTSVDNNFNQFNNGAFLSILDFHYVKFVLPPLGENVSGCIICSAR